MRNYYSELRRAEKLGKSCVRALFYVFLDEMKAAKDVLELDWLQEDIKCLATFSESKELSKMYQELSKELYSWFRENENLFKA